MHRPWAAIAIVAVFVAGCTAPPEPPATWKAWTPLPCDTSGAHWIGLNGSLALPRDPDIDAQAARISAMVGDRITRKLFQRNETGAAHAPLAGQWSTNRGNITLETGSQPDSAADESFWTERAWLYQTNRAWPSREADDAAAVLRERVADLTGLDPDLLHNSGGTEEVGESPETEAAEGESKSGVWESLGDGLANVTVARVQIRIRDTGDFTKLSLQEGIQPRDGVQFMPATRLAANADLFMQCWMAGRTVVGTSGNGTATLVRGTQATHLLDGSVVDEVAYVWDPPATSNGCLGTRPLGVIVDAESGVIRDVRVSQVFDGCRP
ncbi:MAG: hypothetical protein ABR562_09210 [Thermoplasmatota archaeon]